MQTITIKKDTCLKDLKKGDLVMTAELMRVVEVRDNDYISCVSVIPECNVCGAVCNHEFVKHIGWGQQGIVKVVKGK